MRKWFALALAAAGGCGFEHGAASTGGDDMPMIDGSVIDGTTVNPGAEPTPCQPNFLNLCGQAAASMTLDSPGVDSINTDTDPRCRTLAQTNGGPVCLVYVTSASISGQLIATGSRPLAIASASTITISGVIDVASRRADNKTGPAADGTCTFSATPEMDLGGAGGGAGGSFGLVGGDGGHGDDDNSLGNDAEGAAGLAGTAISPTALRGGCRGQAGANETTGGQAGGAGGHSGGALYLYAATSITIASTGVIRASGAGGSGGGAQAGGGGGGAGGMVVLESPQMTIAGVIAANGGGGGEGGARVSNGGIGGGTTNISGQPGTDGTSTTTPAGGGQGADSRFGFGGAGGAGTTAAVNGTSADTGGGGGGGAVGIVHLIGTSTVTGTLTPGKT
jgi:hypothetical protein